MYDSGEMVENNMFWYVTGQQNIKKGGEWEEMCQSTDLQAPEKRE